MKGLLSVSGLTLLVLLLSVSGSSTATFRGVSPGDSAPDFSLPSLEGKQVSLSSYNGKIVLLLMWAADTEGKERRSAELLRTIESILKEHEKRGVAALSINFDKDSREKVAGVVERSGATFPTLLDEQGQVYGSYGVFVLPAVGLVGKDGTLEKAFGYAHDLDKIVDGNVQVLLGLKTEEELASELTPEQAVEQPKELKDADRRLNLGRKMLDQSLFDQAKTEFEEAAKLDPTRPDAFVELGFLLLREGKYDEALERFTSALILDEESAKAHAGVGMALCHKGQLDDAIDELEWATEINPHDALTYYRLGLVYEKKGEKKEALERYKRALNLVFKD